MTTSFKSIANQILEDAGRPLHYRDITQQAIDTGLLKSEGKTPWATMNAQLSIDIQQNGERSTFIRTDPGMYSLNPKQIKSRSIKKSLEYEVAKHTVNQQLSTKQKGDIAEARVAELITLYGDEGLSCYRPVSDDEGIDLIVKRRGKLEVVYVQIKSTFGYKDRGFVSTVKEKSIPDKARMLIVFVYFDLSEGDLFDQVFCVPGSDFLKLTQNETRKGNERVFTVGLTKPDQSKYAEYMIEKRELANRIIEIMDKL